MTGQQRGPKAIQVDDFSFTEAIGGIRGLIETTLPLVVFIAGSAVTPQVVIPLGLTVATTLVLVAIRCLQRLPLRPILWGMAGVGVGALWVMVSGQARDFFALGLVVIAVYLAGLLLSLAVGRNAIGWFVAFAKQLGPQWRRDHPDFVRRSAWATWVWVAVFGLRLAVQGPLYIVGATTALGIAKLVMGLPLFVIASYVTYRLLAGHIPARQPHEDGDTPDPAAAEATGSGGSERA